MIDTTNCTPNQINHIYQLFTYLGYGFENQQQVQTYIQNRYLNPDQEDAIKYALHLTNNFKSPCANPQNKTHNQNAIDIFGTTDCFSYAGFIQPDGTLLDFSEGQNQRVLDHRSVHQVFEETFTSATAPLIRFMREGNIRLMHNGFDLIVPPTPAQNRMLRRFIAQIDELYVDISNQAGKEVWSKAYDYHAKKYALDDITNYFETLFY